MLNETLNFDIIHVFLVFQAKFPEALRTDVFKRPTLKYPHISVPNPIKTVLNTNRLFTVHCPGPIIPFQFYLVNFFVREEQVEPDNCLESTAETISNVASQLYKKTLSRGQGHMKQMQ